MRRDEAWWVCCRCGKPVSKVGKGDFLAIDLQHKKKCPDRGYRMEQVEQNRKNRKGG